MEDIIFSAKQVQGKKALFGKGRFALQNVDFELPSGYIMGIIGENGAGKTTFFRYIMEEKKQAVVFAAEECKRECKDAGQLL